MNRNSPRRVTGEETRQVAFVLSGGASLGAAQVGMLRALLENGIQPDLLIGTSVGAVNAAWIAGRPDLDGVEALSDIWLGLRRQDIFPLSPLTGASGLLGYANHLISNLSLRSVLESHLPFKRLEEAQLPLHVVTTELKSGRAAILTSGPAVPALLASCAIPGVFPPVPIGRREYFDGGVANHTPVTVALELGAREVYVLPVCYPWLTKAPTSALGMALHALARIIERNLESEVEACRNLADIRLLPTIGISEVSPADFSHTRELMDAGYRSARRYLGAVSAKAMKPDAAAAA